MSETFLFGINKDFFLLRIGESKSDGDKISFELNGGEEISMSYFTFNGVIFFNSFTYLV
jgi:hypothetical protein